MYISYSITCFENFFNKDYRGVNLALYALATTGLAISIHKIRPVSKFSKATAVPDYFVRKHQPLKGVFVGIQHSPIRLLINHKAPIYLPLWHSSKPPLPVKVWGVDLISGNTVNWLEGIAKGKKVTITPIGREKDDLVSTVLLHLPNVKDRTTETLDLGQHLAKLGFAKASLEPQLKNTSYESRLAPAILSAEAKAKSYRNGIWLEALPPIPMHTAYIRKALKHIKDIITVHNFKITFLISSLFFYKISKFILYTLFYVFTNTIAGFKYLLLKASKISKANVKRRSQISI